MAAGRGGEGAFFALGDREDVFFGVRFRLLAGALEDLAGGFGDRASSSSLIDFVNPSSYPLF